MEAIVDIARRGQMTIPKNIRDASGIAEGQKYGLRALEGGVLVLTPRGGRAAALQQLRSELLSKGATLEEMLAELRRMREADGEIAAFLG